MASKWKPPDRASFSVVDALARMGRRVGVSDAEIAEGISFIRGKKTRAQFYTDCAKACRDFSEFHFRPNPSAPKSPTPAKRGDWLNLCGTLESERQANFGTLFRWLTAMQIEGVPRDSEAYQQTLAALRTFDPRTSKWRPQVNMRFMKNDIRREFSNERRVR